MPLCLGSDGSTEEPSSWEKSLTPSPTIYSPCKTGDEEIDNLWDSGQEWILIFDKLLKHPRGRTKGCKCDMCLLEKNQHYENSDFQPDFLKGV